MSKVSLDNRSSVDKDSSDLEGQVQQTPNTEGLRGIRARGKEGSGVEAPEQKPKEAAELSSRDVYSYPIRTGETQDGNKTIQSQARSEDSVFNDRARSFHQEVDSQAYPADGRAAGKYALDSDAYQPDSESPTKLKTDDILQDRLGVPGQLQTTGSEEIRESSPP